MKNLMNALIYTHIVYLIIISIIFYALKFIWKKSIFSSIALSLLIGQIFLIVFSPTKSHVTTPENPAPMGIFNSYELLYWAIQIVTPMIVYSYVIYTVFVEKACYYQPY